MNRATADALREMRNGDDGKGKTRSQRKREKERDSKKKWEGVTGRAEDVFTDQEDSSTDKEPNADGKQKKTGGVTRGKATIKFCYEDVISLRRLIGRRMGNGPGFLSHLQHLSKVTRSFGLQSFVLCFLIYFTATQ
ncbi:hypothetical protein BT69DRAFT_1087428 [Atractiella rhizophila]|nr:hypothetical protein BT69DRAFT_1087428 [Atractiella rhizophila]